MGWLILILACLLVVSALLGCFLPVIPGPPLAFLAVLLLSFTAFGASVSTQFLIWAGIGAAAITLLDYLIPVLGTRTFGGSKAGVTGSIVGLILGIVFFPPMGIIVGPFVGAVFGEMLTGNRFREALRSGFGSFVGFLFGTGIKLAYTITMIYYFVDYLEL